MDFVTRFRGYKTVIFNVAIAVASVVAGQDVVDGLTSLGMSTDQVIEVGIGFVAAVNVALRAITNSPIFKR